MRLLLPLSVVVGLVYVALIPFHVREPFENRDVLLVYNAMLFAVVALLVGATPMRARELSHDAQAWLRRGILALAALALVVSAYALTAILYRTAMDRLTPNRLTFIGWNVVNFGLLALLIANQARLGAARWIEGLHRTFAAAAHPYVAWVVVTILALPWLFGVHQGDVAALPAHIQAIVTREPYPILLKCDGSPHIYLLDGGRKHWIKDISTFEARGFEWSDVSYVDCADIDAVPDGAPIPPNAGAPPTLTPEPRDTTARGNATSST